MKSLFYWCFTLVLLMPFSVIADGDGFESGAGMTMAQSKELWRVFLVGCLFLAMIVAILGSVNAWRKQEVELGVLGGNVLRAVLLVCVVVVFLGLSY